MESCLMLIFLIKLINAGKSKRKLIATLTFICNISPQLNGV